MPDSDGVPRGNEPETSLTAVNLENSSLQASVNNQSTESSFSKPRNKKPIILGVILIIFLLLGSLYYFLIYSSDKNNIEKEADIQNHVSTYLSTPEAITGQVALQMKGKQFAPRTTSPMGGFSDSGVLLYDLPVNKLNSEPFTSSPFSGSGVSFVASKDLSETNYKNIVQYFEKYLFTKKSSEIVGNSSLDASKATPTISYSVYTSGGNICSVRQADATNTDLEEYITSVGCSNEEAYKKAYKLTNPLYSSYQKAHPTTSSDQTYGLVAAGEGLNNYEYVVLYQKDDSVKFPYSDSHTFMSYYYKMKSVDKWTYYDSSQNTTQSTDTISCERLGTTVAKEAFHGVDCWSHDAQKMSTLK